MRLVPALALFLPLLSGCAAGPDFKPPALVETERFTPGPEPVAMRAAEGVAQRFDAAKEIPPDWWKIFGSPELDRMIEDALRNNPTAQSAAASLRVAEDDLRAGSGIFYPSLDTGFDAVRQRFAAVRFAQKNARIFNLFTLSTTVTYALDLFGGERRQVEGLAAAVDVQKAVLQGTWLTLTGNIVNTVLARAGYEAEIEAMRMVIGLEKEEIRAAEAQFQAGTAPYSALLSLQSQLASSEAAVPPIEQALNRAEHLQARLSGHAPGAGVPPVIGFAPLTLPAELPRTLPSALLRRRPDILAAEGRLHEASARIGVATAALFPSITLTSDYGVNATRTRNLLNQASSFWSIGAAVTAPVFHGGTLEAERQAAIDAHEAALADYRETVLSAFTQVADTMRALDHDAEALDAQSRAQERAKEALDLIQANYAAGLANYLQLELATIQYQQARIASIQARTQRFQDTVALYLALGGGWQEYRAPVRTPREEPPAPASPAFPR